jgi:4-carboxymuconolactone decarboxylase
MTTVAEGGTPLLDTLRQMTEVSLRNAALAPRELLLVRLACLIASDASGSSFLYNLAGPSAPALTADEVQAVLTAAAPLVGTARTVTAAERIAEATGYAISVHDLMAAEGSAG